MTETGLESDEAPIVGDTVDSDDRPPKIFIRFEVGAVERILAKIGEKDIPSRSRQGQIGRWP